MSKLVFGAGQADSKPLHLAEPAFAFGFGDAGVEIVADVDESLVLFWIWPQE